MPKENSNRESVRSKRQLELNLQLLRILNKLVLKDGRMLNKALKTSIIRQLRNLAKLLELIPKAKLNKLNKKSRKAPRMRKRALKRQLFQKSHWPNKLNKNSNKWQELTPKEKPRMLVSTLNKELKMLDKASRRQLDTKVQPCNRLNRTLLKDGRKLNKVHPMHTRLQQINWVMLGVISSKKQDRRLNRQARLWNRRVMLCRRMLDFDEYYFEHLRFMEFVKFMIFMIFWYFVI